MLEGAPDVARQLLVVLQCLRLVLALGFSVWGCGCGVWGVGSEVVLQRPDRTPAFAHDTPCDLCSEQDERALK